MRETIHIVGNADNRFFPGLCVAFLSALRKASGKLDYHFYILDGGLSENQISQLDQMIHLESSQRHVSSQLECLEVNMEKLISLPERRGSRMMYTKFILPDLLPHVDYVIYLDSDILVNVCLENILPQETDPDANHLLAGVRDYLSILKNDCPWIETLTKREKLYPYINSGLMGMNLKKIRDGNLLDKAIKLRADAGKQRFADQAAFNYVCRGNIKLLPSKYNYFVTLGSGRDAHRMPNEMNLHYIGTNNPWLSPPNPSQYAAHSHWHHFADQYKINRDITKLIAPDQKAINMYKRKKWSNILNRKRANDYAQDLQSIKNKS